MQLHHHKQQLQPAPKLMRQPSLKKVEYFIEVPAMDDQEVEPAVPKGFGSLAVRRVRRRVARGLGATFNFLSQLDEQECVDESGFTYQHDPQVESVVRPAEERRWMLEVAPDGAASWTFSFVCDDAEEQEQEQFPSTEEPIDRRLLLSRKASDF